MDIVRQLSQPGDELDLDIEGKRLHVSHLDREMWPGITKRDLLRYYVRVAKWMLPHLKDRPLGFVQYPMGLGGPRKFERHWWEERTPAWVGRAEIYSVDKGEPTVHLMANDLASLLWFAQISAYELHPWYSRITPSPCGDDCAPEGEGAGGWGSDFSSSEAALEASALNYPDFLVIDLDPPPIDKQGEAWEMTVEAAFAVKGLLDGIGLESFVKTSGKAGLHLFVPIERIYDYDTVRSLAETIARSAVASRPDLFTIELRTAHRPKKVYFDFNQNVRAKTLVAAYSPRETREATVSMPLRWSELERVQPGQFTVHTVPQILARQGDAWKDILRKPQRLV